MVSELDLDLEAEVGSVRVSVCVRVRRLWLLLGFRLGSEVMICVRVRDRRFGLGG